MKIDNVTLKDLLWDIDTLLQRFRVRFPWRAVLRLARKASRMATEERSMNRNSDESLSGKCRFFHKSGQRARRECRRGSRGRVYGEVPASSTPAAGVVRMRWER
jgi:hypothetical protein